MTEGEVVVNESGQESKIDEKMNYSYFILLTLRDITKKVSERDISGITFLIKDFESNCPFKEDYGWIGKIRKLDGEFYSEFLLVKNMKESMYESVFKNSAVKEIEVQVNYWMARKAILMKMIQERGMLYKESVTGEDEYADTGT